METTKHYCRICKKQFACGQALGGHMRAHGMSDELIPDVDGDLAATGKMMYTVRTTSNVETHFCRFCGGEFDSLYSFMQHNCSSTAAAAREDDGADDLPSTSSSPASKRRRFDWTPKSITHPPRLTEEEELANFLVHLSNNQTHHVESSPSENINNLDNSNNPNPPPALFECKTCNKAFTSHQALGGHRASHKKVKGCFAARVQIRSPEPDHPNESSSPAKDSPEAMPTKKSSKAVHECSICHRQFLSGQALGGHKRRHWIDSRPPEHAAVAEPVAPSTVQPTFDSVDRHLELSVPTHVDVSTEICLRPAWDDGEKVVKNESLDHDEADSNEWTMNKLSNLRDLNDGEDNSTWLQVGIGSNMADSNESS